MLRTETKKESDLQNNTTWYSENEVHEIKKVLLLVIIVWGKIYTYSQMPFRYVHLGPQQLL